MDTSRLEIIRQCNPAQNPDKTRYTWDERGMGLLFAEAYRDALRYCPERKTWYAYADGRWQLDAGALLCAEQIKAFSRKQPKNACRNCKTVVSARKERLTKRE